MLVKIVTILKLNYLVNYSQLFILIEFKSTLANNIPFVRHGKIMIFSSASRFQFGLKFDRARRNLSLIPGSINEVIG